MKRISNKGFSIVEILLVVVVLAVVGFAVFYVVNQDSDDDAADTDEVTTSETSTENTEAEEASDETEEVAVTEESTASDAVIEEETVALYSTGYRNENVGIILDFMIGPGFSEYWAEIGQTPDDLSLQTAKRSDGLGYAIDEYGGFTVVVDTDDLPEGDDVYFYRIAATKDGVTHYTGINAFGYK